MLKSIVVQWARQFPADQITLRVAESDFIEVQKEISQANIRLKLDTYPRWAKYHALAICTITDRAHQYDAIFSQNFCPPFSTAVRVVLVHDVLFATNPEWFTRGELLYLRNIRRSLIRATTVLATSKSEATRISSEWPELRGRLVQVGLGVPTGFADAIIKRPECWTKSDPFILTVGRLNVRKNLSRLIDAFKIVAARYPLHHLLVVGEKDGAYVEKAVPSSIARKVHFLGYLTDEEIRWLYQNCDLFVFPSLGEGFGLPIVEASSVGARVIASDIEVFRELQVVTDYFDPTSIEEIAAAIQRCLSRPPDPKVGRASCSNWEEVVGRIRKAATSTAS